MYAKTFKRSRPLALALSLFAACAAGLALSVVTIAPVAAADLASAKATVRAAKTQGIVGEQGDGYLGLVTGSADPNVGDAVNAMNQERKKTFNEIAAKSGVTVDAAGQAAATQFFAMTPSGQYYKPLGGGWTKKP